MKTPLSVHPGFQRAANGGSDPSWLNLAFLGRPDFPSRGPKTLLKWVFRTSGLKIGAPQKRHKSYHDGSDPPFAAL